jgi:hypothetical protein
MQIVLLRLPSTGYKEDPRKPKTFFDLKSKSFIDGTKGKAGIHGSFAYPSF